MTTKTTKRCKYLPPKKFIDQARDIIGDARFRYFSRWAMDNSGFEVIREHDEEAAIPSSYCQEWMPVKRGIKTSEGAEEWCEVFRIAEYLQAGESA